MAFTAVEVLGTIQNASGSPAANAVVQFTLTASIVDTTTGITITPVPQTATTDSNGDFSITLVATDDANTKPSGQAYRCEVQVPGGIVSGVYGHGTKFPRFYFPLPSSAAPQVNLVQLISQYTLPSYTGPGFQPGYYDQTTAMAETLPRRFAVNSQLPLSGSLYISYFTPGWDVTVSHLGPAVTGAASGTTMANIGLYSADSSDNLTLIASTGNITSMFNSIGLVSATLSQSVVLHAGQRYAVGILWAGSVAPTLASETISLGSLPPRITGSISSQVILPSAVTASNLGPTPASLWVRLT